jgi:ubiquinone/menaquinone biosynthesis C-methylase UbiE
MSFDGVQKPEREMQRRDDALWEWSVFWQSDQLDSCIPVNAPDDSDQLISTWREFFGALSAGARILDIGTGNGSVAAQAVAVSQEESKRFSIHGIDLAEIDPPQFVTSARDLLQEITFHPCTPMEKLPFADNHFDAVASQYALEYSQTDKSLAEAMRVLRARGHFRFLLHAQDGALKSRSQLQRRQAETILGSSLFVRLKDALENIVAAEQQRAPRVVTGAEESIAALKGVFDELERKFSQTENRSLVDNLFAAVRRLPNLRRSYDLKTLLAMADDIRELLIAQAKRLQAMERAALDDVAAKELIKQLRINGATAVMLERAATGEGHICVGYWLHGEKAAGSTQDC